MSKVKKLTTKEFDELAESGDMDELAAQFDLENATKRFNVDMPVWALNELDKEATRRGITRQALVKGWLVDRLDAIRTQNQHAEAALEALMAKAEEISRAEDQKRRSG